MSDSPAPTDIVVTVKYLVHLRELAGRPSEELSLPAGCALRDAVSRLSDLHGIKLPDPTVAALLNGTGWARLPDGLDTRLAHGDAITLLPQLSGG